MFILQVVFFVFSLIILASITNPVFTKERQGKVTIQFNLNASADAKNVRLWVPYPVSDENQDIWDVNVSGNFSKSSVYREGENGNIALYAEWDMPTNNKTLTYTFKVKRKEVVKKDFPKKELPFSKEEFKEYLKATSLGPTTGKVKEVADKITNPP